MKKTSFSSIKGFLLVLGLAVLGCDASSENEQVNFNFTRQDSVTLGTNFGETCSAPEDELSICATPSEYTISTVGIRMVICYDNRTVDKACSLNNDGEYVDSVDFSRFVNGDRELSFGQGLNLGNVPLEDNPNFESSGLVFAGLELRMEAVTATFPDNNTVSETYRGALVRLCLIDDCVEGAERGDYLVALANDLDNFQWFDATMATLTSSRPNSPLQDATIAAAENSSSYRFTATYMLDYLPFDEFLSVVSGDITIFTIAADFSNVLECTDSDSNGVCSPENFEFFKINLATDFDITRQNFSDS